ncbi:EutP/PduV family microcompartment system protein [Angelakisella massiliensis]|uniref:EutP/PduV family microcompartment system protein n=1 Tax=Angelakisella massiliensis TaxID=1871018 RepID=UPI0008F8D5C2|nr:EutP/PduV family microcompartment system protein [Angelakisella massiliensis]
MKKIILMGNSFCGKTTLCQRLAGKQLVYKKTQAIEVVASAIDTPGEYLENRGMYKALVVTAVEADVILFVQDATDSRFRFSPGQASMFANPVVGVVTKTDLATEAQVEQAESLLRLAGASRVFRVSAVTGEGMEELTNWLSE